MLLSDGRVLPDSLFAETTPILTNGYFYAKDGVNLAKLHATYGQLYRNQVWVQTVVDKIANSASRLSLKTWDISAESGKSDADETAYGKLIANPSTTMDSFSFWRWVFSTYEVYGEAFLIKVRPTPGAAPSTLLPMHPSRTIVRRATDGSIEYIFTLGVASAGLFKTSADDVIPFRRYNPDTQLRGMSRLEGLRMTLLNEDAARRAQASFWERGARPSVFLKASKTMSEEAARKLQRQFSNLNSGPDNAGRVAVLEDGTDAQIVQLNMEEMQYIESRKLNREEVCGAYDVPPPVVHILDRATFSNITEQMRSMYRDTMMPRLLEIESILDYHLRPEFDTKGVLKATYMLDDVLRGDFEQRADAAVKLVQSAIMKPSEGRQLFDLPDAGEIAHKLYGNAALVELGQSDKQKVNVDINGNIIPTPLNQSASEKQISVRSVAGILGREKSLDDMKKAVDNLLAVGMDEVIVKEAFDRVSSNKKKGSK